MEQELHAVLTVKETAKLLRTGENQIYAALNNGQLYGFKVGGSWKVPRAGIERKLSGEGESIAT